MKTPREYNYTKETGSVLVSVPFSTLLRSSSLLPTSFTSLEKQCKFREPKSPNTKVTELFQKDFLNVQPLKEESQEWNDWGVIPCQAWCEMKVWSVGWLVGCGHRSLTDALWVFTVWVFVFFFLFFLYFFNQFWALIICCCLCLGRRLIICLMHSCTSVNIAYKSIIAK